MFNFSRRVGGRAALPILIVLVIVAVLFAFLMNYHAARSRPAVAQRLSWGASASSEVFLVGTLAPLGSFDYQTAPLLTELAVKRRRAADALLRKSISIDEAVAIQADADGARDLIDQATAACDEAPHTGKCLGSRVKVDQLLTEAKNATQAVPDAGPTPIPSAQ